LKDNAFLIKEIEYATRLPGTAMPVDGSQNIEALIMGRSRAVIIDDCRQ